MASPDTPLASRFLQARHYRPARAEAVGLIVLHSTEGALATPNVAPSAMSVAQMFAAPGAPQASAHYIVDASGIVQCVRECDVAWHAPPVNEDQRTHEVSIGIEHCGWAHWAPEQWPAALRERSAALVADICRRHPSLPVVYLDAAGLVRVERPRGITTHRQVSLAWHKSSHWDPGDGFDAPGLVEMVRAVAPADRA